MHKTLLAVALVIVLIGVIFFLNHVPVGITTTEPDTTTLSDVESTEVQTGELDTEEASNEPAKHEMLPDQIDDMKIKFIFNNTEVTAALTDTNTAKDFVSLLPLTISLEDYANTEKIAYLPRKLTVVGAPAGSDPSVGDIAYYAPWGNLVVFYKDFGYSNGLVILGQVDDVEVFSSPETMSVTIELVE